LWPPIECVGALAAFCLDKLGRKGEALGFGEAPHGIPLGIDTEARAPLSLRLHQGGVANYVDSVNSG
jgi:hypothetical protein